MSATKQASETGGTRGARGGERDRERVCRRIRRQLCATPPAAARRAAELRGHLESCPACAAFERRLAAARRELGRPLLPGRALEPDAGFPARLMARLGRPADVLGWAAFRALPAALGLALALAWLGFSASSVGGPSTGQTPAALAADDANPSPDQLMAFSAAPPEVLP